MALRRLFVALSLLLPALWATPAFPYITTVRVSVSTTGEEGNDSSQYPAISADGRFVAFRSWAINLVPGEIDLNLCPDIFVRDRRLQVSERVSLSTTGEIANDMSDYPAISANGRFVAFHSWATNLAPGETNPLYPDVFVRDRNTATTECVSISTTGEQGNQWSYQPSVSGDGRFVAFTSLAGNLIPSDANGKQDIFVRDRDAGTTERVSVSTSGGTANGPSGSPSISEDGRFVAFESDASSLVSGDANGIWDIFVRDRDAGTTERVSVSSGGAEANNGSWSPSISADGRFVVFESEATSLVVGDANGMRDIFLHDRQTGTTERVSVSGAGAEGNAHSYNASISGNGRFVAFHSDATDLAPGDTNGSADVFLRDWVGGVTERVSVGIGGVQGNGSSYDPSITDDGRLLAFHSNSSNLVPIDANHAWDVFVRGPAVPRVLLEVHPNERAPGAFDPQLLGWAPWTQPTSSPASTYWWKKYEFYANGPIWIQVCAQNWNQWQKGYAADDNTWVEVNGIKPIDYDGIQQGNPGGWQWVGSKENGQRWTLRFLHVGAPGKHSLWIGADESPVLWWLKVTHLAPGVIEAIE